MRLRLLVWRPGTGPASAAVAAVAAGLGRTDWEVAVLPGMPPPAAASLSAALAAEWRAVPVRSGLAEALRRRRGRPVGAILARWDRIIAHRTAEPRPEGAPGWAHAVQLACGVWVAAGAGPAAAGAAREWAAGEPLVLAAELPRHRELALAALGHNLHLAGSLRVAEPVRALDTGVVVVGLALRAG